MLLVGLDNEESYEAQEDSGESDWLGREHLVPHHHQITNADDDDDDDDVELNAIGTHFRVVKKKIRNKTVQASHLEPPFILGSVVENEDEDRNEEAENEANRTDENAVNEKEADEIGDKETDGADESETGGNEESSVGLSTGEETDYLGSSYVESYETDSYGDFVSRKTTKNKRASYTFVGKHFISKIMIVPKLRLMDMMRLGMEELNVELNKQLCSRAKKWAEEKIKGTITHEFNRLLNYVLALRIADPNCSFDLVVKRPTAADILKFKRLYVCFGAL
ncbi:hypothetical protein V6N11_079613 [Hibiscus sabdariffa]|uniref:Uncharacterized protein n=1 Tax=Hibiscus sabdariffa TaxID=183260 RepID=A0ABR2RW78_9ROSI